MIFFTFYDDHLTLLLAMWLRHKTVCTIDAIHCVLFNLICKKKKKIQVPQHIGGSSRAEL